MVIKVLQGAKRCGLKIILVNDQLNAQELC